MPLLKTKKILTITLIVDIILFSIFVFIYLNIKSAGDEFSSKAILIESELDKQTAFLSMKKDLEANSIGINNLSNYVISSDGIVDFMKSLDKLTLNNGLKSEVKSISFTPISGSEYQNLELADIKIDVIGEWRNVEYFLKVLENYPLSLSITNFSMSKFSDYQVKGKKIPQWLGSFDFTVLKMK